MAGILLAGLALGALQPGAAPAPPPAWTAAAARQMAPAALTRRLFGDMAAALVPDDLINHGFLSQGRLRTIWFLGVPRYSNEAGLCDADRIVAHFTSVAPADLWNNDDVPVRPDHIERLPGFIVLDATRVRGPRRTSAAERIRQQAACAAIDPRSARRIFALAPVTVIRGIADLDRLISLGRARRLEGMLDCRRVGESGWPAIDTAACARTLSGFGLADLTGVVTECGPPDRSRCRTLWIGAGYEGYSIEIHFDREPDPEASEQPVRIMVGRNQPPPRMY